jgi:hypothetical protein
MSACLVTIKPCRCLSYHTLALFIQKIAKKLLLVPTEPFEMKMQIAAGNNARLPPGENEINNFAYLS